MEIYLKLAKAKINELMVKDPPSAFGVSLPEAQADATQTAFDYWISSR